MFARRRLTLFVVLMGAALAAPFVTFARNPITIEMQIGDNCVGGFGPGHADVVGTLRAPNGDVRGRFLTRTDKFGSWQGCFEQREPATYTNGGDILKIVIGNRSKTVTIPRITPRIDRVNDTVTGRTRPHTSVDILIAHRVSFHKTDFYFYTGKGGADGLFRIDTSADFDLIGFDEVTVMDARGDDFYRATVLTPGIQVAHASNFVTGTANNGRKIGLVLLSHSGKTKAEVTAGSVQFGLFRASMFNDRGQAAYPAAGDTLLGSYARDAQLRMPLSYINASERTDVVTGRCMPNAPYQVFIRARPFHGMTDATGHLNFDASFRANVHRGDQLRLWCMFPTGDVWQDVGQAR